MRITRALLAAAGLAGLAFGLVLAVRFALNSARDGWAFAFWFVGGPVLHDAVLAPVVGALGLLAGRWLGPHWRTPIMAGAVVSGVLALLSVPVLWRIHPAPANPGLHDRAYGTGFLVALGVVWALVALAGVWRDRRRWQVVPRGSANRGGAPQ